MVDFKISKFCKVVIVLDVDSINLGMDTDPLQVEDMVLILIRVVVAKVVLGKVLM